MFLEKLHKYKVGLLKNCQICGNNKLKQCLDLGYQPLADDLLKLSSKKRVNKYPIKVSFCNKCVLLQNDYIVGDKVLYKKNYHYMPGITKDVIKNFKNLSKTLKKKYKLKKKDLIIDAGCNDGSLLLQFRKIRLNNLVGIDPTDTIKIAKKKKINTFQNYLNQNISRKIVKKHGKAKIIVTTNVFAHTNNLFEFISAVKNMIKEDGIFIIENHYLLDVVQKLQFDTFYHEHLRTYSLKSLIELLKYYDFQIVDAYRSERYGGNIQAHFSLKKYKPSKNVISILESEKKYKLDKFITYKKFKNKIEKSRKDLSKFLLKHKNSKIVGKAFPARASILINYYYDLKKYLKYIAEQKTSLKLNYFAPGSKIPIISSKNMVNDPPDVMIILAWHLFDTIKKKWKNIFKKRKVKIVKILPKLRVY